VLAAPVLGQPFTVVCDACQVGIGALLLQNDRPIAYESRKLNPAERNYHPGEFELLAVIHALHTWRCYLEGADFTLMTDHSPNTFFASKSILTKRQTRWQLFLQLFVKRMTWKYIQGHTNIADPLSRLPQFHTSSAVTPTQQLSTLVAVVTRAHSRSTAAPQEQPGSSADPSTSSQQHPAATEQLPPPPVQPLPTAPMQQLPDAQASQLPSVQPPVSLAADDPSPLSSPSTSANWRASFTAGYKADPYFKHKDKAGTIYRSDGLWYHRKSNRIVVPFPVRMDILHDAHSSLTAGHFGISKTTKLLQQHYWWPGMRDDVTQYIATCPQCGMNKVPSTKPAGLIQPLPVPKRRFGSISMDFIGALPETASDQQYDSILVIVDRLTKMARFIPCHTTTTAAELAHLFVDHWYCFYGLPESIVTDRGTLFTSQFWSAVHSRLNVKLNKSTAFHPQSDGSTERLNRTLQDALRCYINPRLDDWDTLLPLVQFAYNTTFHSSIGMTPMDASMGFKPVTFLSPPPLATTNVPAANQLTDHMKTVVADVQRCLEAARQRQLNFANAHRSELSFEVGQQVWLSTQNLKQKVRGNTSKLTPRYWGPFKIVKKVGPVAYALDLPSSMQVHPVFHVSLLKQYHEGTRIGAPPPPVILDGNIEYEVEMLLDHKEPRTKRGKRYYLVH
jgi:hypothetical protein